MTRLLLLLLSALFLLTETSIPVTNGRPLVCTNYTPVKSLRCGIWQCTVHEIVNITRLSLIDFILLQNGSIKGPDNAKKPITPPFSLYTSIPTDYNICVAGYYN